MALINTTTTGVLGSTFYGDGTGPLNIQQNGVTLGIYGNIPTFSAYNAATTQTLTSATHTKIIFDTEDWDTNNNFSSSTFTPTVAGYYQVQGHIQPAASYTSGVISIYKNGSVWKYGEYNNNAVGTAMGIVSCLVYCNGTTDYVELYGFFQTGQQISAGSTFTWFQGHLVKAV